MPLSHAQIARNRLGGKLRKNPGADVTGLRRDIEAAKAADLIEDGLRVEEDVDRILSWMTDETLAKLAVLLRPDRP